MKPTIVIESASIDQDGNRYIEGEIGYNPMSPMPHGNNISRYVPKTADRSISKDLEDVPLPEEFKAKANEIFSRSSVPTRRSKRRQMMIFYCLILAYKDLNEIEFPELIAKAVGLGPEDMSKSLAMEEHFPNHDISSIKYTPQDFIPRCITIINNELFIRIPCKDVMLLANRVIDIDKSLLEVAPQKVALGIVLYYMRTRGVSYSEEKISDIFCKSITTLQTLIDNIATADNN